MVPFFSINRFDECFFDDFLIEGHNKWTCLSVIAAAATNSFIKQLNGDETTIYANPEISQTYVPIGTRVQANSTKPNY